MNQDNEAESQKAQPIGPIFRSTEYAEAPEIPDEMLARWKTTANLMSEIAGVPTGVITRVHATQLEVLVACDRDDNPYKQGLRADLNTGMCCETVMQERAQLLVPNALKDPEWADNPNVSLGLISYLGFPLQWGNGEIFGTICVLDNKENAFGGTYQKLLETFKHAIESDSNW
jgi:GAF domain-containing protein